LIIASIHLYFNGGSIVPIGQVNQSAQRDWMISRFRKNGSDRSEAYPVLGAWWPSAVLWQKSSACNGQASKPACNQFIWNRGLLSSRYI